jgi:multisubunit Na+/H+ antiporter MnhF subunit
MKIKDYVTLIATCSLLAVVMAMVWMFVQAILDPTVDDKVVFDIIGPAFQTIVGGFIGLITGIHVGKDDDKTE